MPRPSGPWTNPQDPWIYGSCSATRWPRWSSCRKLPPDSGSIFPAVLIPSWPNSKLPFARICYPQKPTTWLQAAIPKVVKHPRGMASGSSRRRYGAADTPSSVRTRSITAAVNGRTWRAASEFSTGFALYLFGCPVAKVQDFASGTDGRLQAPRCIWQQVCKRQTARRRAWPWQARPCPTGFGSTARTAPRL